MPNDVSDSFHSFLDSIKADLSSAWGQIKAIFSNTVTSVLAGLQTDIEDAGPQVLQIITTAVVAAATDGMSAFAPALSAALVALEKEGITVAEHVVSGTVSAVIANLPTPSVPASKLTAA